MEDLIVSLLPLILIIILWIIIMIRMKKKSKNNKYVQNQDEMIGLLKEIKEELKHLNGKQ
jgi:preprotein translocase subunit YajC